VKAVTGLIARRAAHAALTEGRRFSTDFSPDTMSLDPTGLKFHDGRLILAKQPQISPRIIGNDSVSVMIAQPRLARLLPTTISYYLPPARPPREHRSDGQAGQGRAAPLVELGANQNEGALSPALHLAPTVDTTASVMCAEPLGHDALEADLLGRREVTVCALT
jgi:hypothetical protein